MNGNEPTPQQTSALGERPRLSERALPRLHFVDGKCRVLVHDIETGDVIELGPREWVLLASADGTRDVDGVRLAAEREGVRVSREALCTLLSAIRDAGMLADGPPLRRSQNSVQGAGGPPEQAPKNVVAQEKRPIEHLPGYLFRCDGHGSCCRLYATIVFSPLEAARARATLPDVLDGGERHEHVFMPERGAGPCPGSAVALVNGRCAYLDGDLCSIHRAAGAQSKPLGCNLFPLSLVDDGTRVRASVAVECACVLESVGGESGDPILPDHVAVRGDLDPAIVVDDLPSAVEVGPGNSAELSLYLAWSDAALSALSASEDAAITAWSLASGLDAHGLDPEAARSAIETPANVDVGLAGGYIKALGEKARLRAKAQNAWRGKEDLCRRGVNIIAAASELLADSDVLSAIVHGAGSVSSDEAFYLRVALFGHQLVGYPLSVALRDRAVAIFIARIFPLAASALYPGDQEPAFAHPLALVEALLRGHGLRRYTESVTPPPTTL